MPRYRALLIGNALYLRDPELRTLKGPSADVAALFAALTDADTGLFDPDAIEPLIDRGVQDLREKVHQFLVEDATRDDILLLYYSGHGRLDLTSRLHLCAIDTRTSALRPTALRYAEDVEAAINESPAASVVTVLDCCYSGAFRGDGEIMVEATGSGRCVMTSASATQLAIDEARDGSPSPFTEAFAKGLRSAKAQGHLTAQQLYDYISREIRDARPQFRYDGEGSIALARRSAIAPLRSPATAAPTTPAPRPPTATLALPVARNRIEHLLNKAATAALEQPDAESLHDLLRRSAALYRSWSIGVLSSMPIGEPRLRAVEGYAAGLAALDPNILPQQADAIFPSWSDRVFASLAFAGALPPEHLIHAEAVLRWLLVNLPPTADDRFTARGLATLFVVFVAANARKTGGSTGMSEFSDQLLAAASAANPPAHLVGIIEKLAALFSKELESRSNQVLRVEAGLRLALVEPHYSKQYFAFESGFPSPEAFAEASAESVLTAATSLSKADSSTAYRLFRIAEEHCRTEADRVDLLIVLLKLLARTDRPHLLLPEIERAAARVPDDGLELLSAASLSLAERAPDIAERLLRLEPNEDYRRYNLISAAERAAESDPEASRRMLTSAERLAHSITDPILRDAALIGVAEGYAVIDPDRAIQTLRSLPRRSERRLIALQQVARVFAARWPDRIGELLFIASEAGDKRSVGSVAEGLAELHPGHALRIADEITDARAKNSVLKQVALGLLPDEPDRVHQIALSMAVPDLQAKVLLALVESVAPKNAADAAIYCGDFRLDTSSLLAKSTAIAVVAKHMHKTDPVEAASLLDRAVLEVSRVDDSFFGKGAAIVSVAKAAAEFDLSRASTLLATADHWARGRTDSEDRHVLLGELAVAWAPMAPRRSEEAARGISEDWEQLGSTIAEAVRAMADIDSRTAERMARTIADDDLRNRTLARLAVSLSDTSPVQAEAIADSLPPSALKVDALLTVAEALNRE
ncbi:caspase family protein [Glycomyces dulcitolivorans]|uniref:caspase family protein n=1 Tax=Glycomyces dulcitolivorans TaxID=2200759 RepID=UPI000DD42CAC|nr:caspase family protein [Glycomyces dulcitolivorans]